VQAFRPAYSRDESLTSKLVPPVFDAGNVKVVAVQINPNGGLRRHLWRERGERLERRSRDARSVAF
jgi:hypothetical protein